MDTMETNPAATPIVVLPGDDLQQYLGPILDCQNDSKNEQTEDTQNQHKSLFIFGPGLRKHEDKIYASKAGVLKMRNNNLFWIDSHQKRYVASRGEYVIGIVHSKSSTNARVDINSSDLASLSLLAFEGSTKRNKPNINVGDLVYAKVLSASKHMDTELVCVSSAGKKEGMGVIGDKGGRMVTLSIDTVRMLLNPDCNLLEKLGEMCKYEIALGMNGRAWVSSSEDSIVSKVIEHLTSV